MLAVYDPLWAAASKRARFAAPTAALAAAAAAAPSLQQQLLFAAAMNDASLRVGAPTSTLAAVAQLNGGGASLHYAIANAASGAYGDALRFGAVENPVRNLKLLKMVHNQIYSFLLLLFISV